MKKNLIFFSLICMTFSIRSFAQKPNIIYILADDLGIGDVSAYNPKGKIQTTNIQGPEYRVSKLIY